MITITIYKYLLMSIETEEISMPGLKYSRQRESIINCLKGRKDHPTADMIYASVREEYPKISLGTVYRNLSLLVDQGEILRFSCGEGQDHYDADTSQHYHFVCSVYWTGYLMRIPVLCWHGVMGIMNLLHRTV